MSDLIKIKGGSGAAPPLSDRELGYSKTEKALYIGAGNKNERLCGAGDVSELSAKIKELEETIEVLKAKPDYYTKEDIDGLVADITARLDALENQSE